MAHNARQLVLRSLPIFLANPNADWPTLVRALQYGLGVSEPLAKEIGAFVPIAFGRLLFMMKGIYADPRCARLGAQPLKYERLDSLPIFNAAMQIASEVFLTSDQMPYKQYIVIAGWSAELNNADRMMDQGSRASDLMIGPVMTFVPGTDEPFDDDEGEEVIEAEIVD
jgi:hypothetical protein